MEEVSTILRTILIGQNMGYPPPPQRGRSWRERPEYGGKENNPPLIDDRTSDNIPLPLLKISLGNTA